jgi:DNA polymerase-3 subunit alpha
VAYALTITDLDPAALRLLFERFLNPERVSMPDFDIDFCQDRREEVIRYVQEKYGRDQVAQIITFGTLQGGRAARRGPRAANALWPGRPAVQDGPGQPGQAGDAGQGDRGRAAAASEEAAKEEVVARCSTIAQQLEGLYRNASTHAAGVVIGDRPLTELVPLYRDPRSDMPATQFNMKWVEQAGLVKFDFLGLKTLTVIQTAVKMIKRRGIEHRPAGQMPARRPDQATYAMLCARRHGRGVPGGIGAGMRNALVGMKPDRIEDIIALVALYRPGPDGEHPDLLRAQARAKRTSNLHPKMDPIWVAETTASSSIRNR